MSIGADIGRPRLLDRLLGRRPTTAAASLDLSAAAVSRDPFPHYERLRAAGPVQYLVRHGAWIVLGYDEVQTALGQPETFSNRPYAAIDPVMLAADPPDHRAVRRIVSLHFSPQAVARLGAFAEQEATKLLQPRLDIVADYATPLSAAVAGEFLGLDGDALALIRAARAGPDADTTRLISAIDAIADRSAMFGRLRDDGFDEGQARSLVRLLWLAATSTTERAIAHSVLLLLTHENLRDPASVPPFVEEVLRLHPPELLVPRVATRDVELGGAAIPRGALVHLCLAAANRDPSKYEAPAEMRLDRPKRRMLTFGGGPHMCVGAALGRSVLHAAVRTLMAQAPGLRAAQPLDEVVGWSSMTSSPVSRLLVTTGSDPREPVSAGSGPV